MPLIENIHEQEYISKPAPRSHFFTETNSYTQSASQAFGPEAGNLANRFRVTSKFTSTGAKAFACCKGVVLVQPQAGSSTKVNIVLRPYSQPIQGVKIKYFIYRGLKKSDFFNNDLILTPTGTTSDFINKINSDFNSFHSNTNNDPIPPFESKFIGYNPSEQLGTMLLDDIFFKQSQYTTVNNQEVEIPITAYELPMIDIGKSLGNFETGECGVEVVLNIGDYKSSSSEDEFLFNLNFAQKSECYIDFIGANTDYLKKVRREQIYQFLDVAAFYGAHFYEAGSVIIDNNGAKENKTNEGIYDSVISNFFSKNRIYIYVQADRGRSYNFYRNYLINVNSNESLKIGLTDTSLVPISFDENGWPLLIDEVTRNHNDVRNQIFIQFVTDNNPDVALYGQFVRIENAQKNNFFGEDSLPNETDNHSTEVSFTRPVILSNAAIGMAGAKKNVASFNILVYTGKRYNYVAGEYLDEQNIPSEIISTSTNINNLFSGINASPIFKSGSEEVGNFSINKLSLFAFGSDLASMTLSIIQDRIMTGNEMIPVLERMTFLAECVDIMNRPTDVRSTISCNTATQTSAPGNISINNHYEFVDGDLVEQRLFTDSNISITGILLKTENKSDSNKVVIGIAKAEFDLLRETLSPIHKNPYLGFMNTSLQEELISGENVKYKKYFLGIVVELENGSLKFLRPEADIVVYTIDDKFYLSKIYSDNMYSFDFPAELVIDTRS